MALIRGKIPCLCWWGWGWGGGGGGVVKLAHNKKALVFSCAPGNEDAGKLHGKHKSRGYKPP